MEQTVKKNNGIGPAGYFGLVLLAAVSGVLAALCFATPGCILLAVLLWPAAGALQARVLTGIKAGEGPGAVAVLPIVLTVASVFLAAEGDGVRLAASALTVPLTAVVLTAVQRKKLGGIYSCMGAAGCGIVGIYAIVCLPGILSGAGAFTAVKELFAGYAAELKEEVALFAGEALKDVVADFAEQVDALVDLVPDVTTGMIFLTGFIGGLGTVLLYFALTRKKRETLDLAVPGRVADWTVPKVIFRPLFIFYLVAAVLYMFDVANAASIYYVVSVTFSFVTVINGFATAEWLLEKIRRKRGLFRALAYVLTAALPMLAVSPLSTLGFIDCVFHIRRRVIVRNAPRA